MSIRAVSSPPRILVLDLTVEGEPVPKSRVRFLRGGKAYTPAATVAHEQLLEWEMANKTRGATQHGELRVEVDFYRGTRRKCDIDNLVKTLFDAANGIVWSDDTQVVELLARKRVDKKRPRTEVRVWALTDEGAR